MSVAKFFNQADCLMFLESIIMENGVFAATGVDGTQSSNCVDDGYFQEQSISKREESRRLDKSRRRKGRGKRNNNLDKKESEPENKCDSDEIHSVLSLAK